MNDKNIPPLNTMQQQYRDIQTLNARVAELEKALEFYASVENYRRRVSDASGTLRSKLDNDRGDRARYVLKGE